jgi:hypothetical protein
MFPKQKDSRLRTFIRSWMRCRGLQEVQKICAWDGGRRVLLYTPVGEQPYALIVKDKGRPHLCYEHEVALALRPQLRRLFVEAIKDHRCQQQEAERFPTFTEYAPQN